MKFLAYAILFLILFVVQISILPFFSFYGSTPNILFVLCAFLVFYLSSYKDLMFFSFVSALLLDIYSGQSFGVLLISFLVSIAILHFVSKNILGRANFMIVFLGTSIATAIYLVCYLLLLKTLSTFEIIGNIDLGISFLRGAIATVILNFLLAMILFPIFKKFLVILNKT